MNTVIISIDENRETTTNALARHHPSTHFAKADGDPGSAALEILKGFGA